MTNAVWPPFLPDRPLAQGYSERGPETALRTEMDAGPSKMRRRFTAGVRRIDVQVRLTAAQVETLDSFYHSSLSGGSFPFDCAHPRTGSEVTFRFVEPPSYTPIARGQLWTATLILEVLP